MTTIKTQIGKSGRIVIPVQFRKALGVHPGDHLVMSLHEGEIRIFTPEQAIRNIQALVRRYVPEGHSLADELIEERRAESARE
ncbi:MAG: AbrB family transcriptional regulator [SAR202 cluster bacterium Io17-Chloro-G9]|nr:MAG: AbrB family transcriptional regulator [SAR202 cluster bacterium Io17-Chloro-G9]